MDMRKLGRTDLMVSSYCLGTMTFGRQTTEAVAHRQLDMALEGGITFLDAAEMYPVNPVTAESAGETEAIIGRWRAARGAAADRMLVATKCAGSHSDAVRPGTKVTPETMRKAVEGSLARLQTEQIGLYQLHWPTRRHYHFRRYWNFEPNKGNAEQDRAELHALVGTVTDLVAEGKIKAFGVSNETAWGITEWQHVAAATGGARVQTVQNEYSLLCRVYDTDLAEVSHFEDVGLLAFSPLACGMLTGKYSGDVTPALSRRVNSPDLGGRVNAQSLAAADEYVALARAHGVEPVHLAMAFCEARPFMASAIVGATNTDQLQLILDGLDFKLNAELAAGIQAIYRKYPRSM